MTTSTVPTRVTAPRVDVVTDRARRLALVAPLLLFTHGILTWVDDLGAVDRAPGRGSALSIVAGGILALAVAGFASLASTLVSRCGRSELAVPVTLLGAFGAGATAAVWVGRLTGWLVDPLPAGLAAGGALVTALALALALVVHTTEGRMPTGSLALAGAAGALVALPLGLEPLGALVLLTALAPLSRAAEESLPTA